MALPSGDVTVTACGLADVGGTGVMQGQPQPEPGGSGGVGTITIVNEEGDFPDPFTTSFDNLTGATRLPGGDAVPDGAVDLLDLSCIGGGAGACAQGGSTDINADLRTNMQDLALSGGNYSLTTYQPWLVP